MFFVRMAIMPALFAVCVSSAWSVEQVGSTVSVDLTVRGQGAVGDRVIATADPIYQDERLRSNATGLGQFQLGDGTKLVLGRNASIVIDKYVTKTAGTASTVSLRVLAGTFRFITGQSDHRSYKIATPQGTIGIRGTGIEGTIKDKQLNLLLLNGGLTFCNLAGECQDLNDPCDLLVANATGILPAPRQSTEVASADELQSLFPIASDEERLNASFRLNSEACVGGTGQGQGTGTGQAPDMFDFGVSSGVAVQSSQ